jgi:transposase-like protein
MTVEERMRRRFSESFRKEMVIKIESGELTISEISRLYEVQKKNVRAWLKKFGTQTLPDQIIISNAKDYNRVKELETQIDQLKKIIADQQIELVKSQSIVKLAKDHLGKDFEKKC